MTTIKEQIDLEKRMIAYGINRHKHSVKSAEENGRGADTQHAQRLMQAFLEPVTKAIEAYCNDTNPGPAGKYRALLRQVDPYKAAYFGVRAVLNHFTKEEPLGSLGIHIGTMIEDELKFTAFREEHGKYYDRIIQDFQNKGTKSYRHMHRVLTVKANEKNVKWTSWSPADKVSVGVKVVDLIMSSTDMIEKTTGVKKGNGKKAAPVVIKPTAQCLDWVKRFNHYAELLNPDRVPCIIPPDPWISLKQGGYYSPQMRSRTPLIKSKNREHTAKLEAVDLTQVMKAVNKLQETEWEVNVDLYQHLLAAWNQSLPLGLPRSEPYEIPGCPLNKPKSEFTDEEREQFENWKAEARLVHTMERERVSKCFQVIRVLRMAKEFQAYPKFWFVYQCDFRGRVYASSTGLSPQSSDFGKALIRFHEGKPLGVQGANWFKIHGANCFGKDKLPYADRIKWVDDNRDLLLQIAENPLSTREHWAGADKPWQFIAWVLEYKGYTELGDQFVSRLPIALDGSCNGLQNFSAMLRDEVGGKATNLTPAERPCDIYAEVARVLTDRLGRERGTPQADAWLSLAEASGGVLSRNLSKRPVMTLPYGSTRQSCREYIYKYIMEYVPDFFPKEDRFKLSVYLTPVLWASISEVVVAARKAMDWVQECAGSLAKQGKGIQWTTPDGFLVYQSRKKVRSRQVHTELAGHFRLRMDEDTPTVDVQKQRLGAAPNFVHSYDATHLRLMVLRAQEAGIGSIACIHDDFGTHAADTPKLHKCIREAFLELYQNNAPLEALKIENGIEKPTPELGKLDISLILKASYFFG